MAEKRPANLKLSRFNIFSKLKDSDNYFIINLLSGNADFLSPKQAKEIIENKISNPDEFYEKGYLSEEKVDNKLFKIRYLDFLKQQEQDEIQLFFVPRYSCNFTCSYCYQTPYQQPHSPLKKEVVDAFYSFIDSEFEDRRKYITIFGGEPLINNNEAKKEIEWILDGASQRNLDVAVVTNGYYLTQYIDILKKAPIREIQVTLDGTEDIHNKRRTLANNTPTFQQIVDGIDAALKNNFPINLRVVVDKENIGNLSDLAKFAIQKGWTKNPIFKTQMGRNYELHTCQPNNEILLSRLELYEKLYEIIKKSPHFLEFHKPAFSIARFIFENEELPEPLFDACPGTKTEWAFDYTGTIYPCTATVGKKDEEIGTFFPQISLNETKIEEWQDRDITTIKDCQTCPVQLACGGGCASVAKNKTGNMNNPDCRPIKELLEMGLAFYFK